MTALKQMTLPFTEFETDAANDNTPPINRLEAKWREYHAKNPEVYDLIELYAFKAIAAGRTQYGVQSILEMVRWHKDMRIAPDEDGFKLSNNHAAYYARLFHTKNPKYAGFFKTRTVLGE